jgi:drug/metabolite transporter (DMT)-like permease
VNAARWASWAAAAVGVPVAASVVATRFGVAELGPATLAALRYAIGLATLLPFVWHFAATTPSRPRIAMREWPRIALLGIGQFGLLIALLNIGLQTVPAARAA